MTAIMNSTAISRLNELQWSVDDAPNIFQQVKTALPLFLDAWDNIKKTIDAGAIRQESLKIPLAVIEGCVKQIESLDAILLPAEDHFCAQPNHKAASSTLSQHDKIDRISSWIQKSIRDVTFYYAAVSSTYNPGTGSSNNRKIAL